MWNVNVLDTAQIALNLVPRKMVAGISVRAEELRGCDALEKRLFSTIRVVKHSDGEGTTR